MAPVPGNIPGLVPGSKAAAEWWAAQIAQQGRLAHHVGKREAEDNENETSKKEVEKWGGYGPHGHKKEAEESTLKREVEKRQAAMAVVPGNIPGLVPGSKAAAEWWAAQIAHQGKLAHHQGKRAAEGDENETSKKEVEKQGRHGIGLG